MGDLIHPKPQEFTAEQIMEDPILRYFHYAHLPEMLRGVSAHFCALAVVIVTEIPRNAERTVALRKLLESKDAGVRANVPAAPARTETFFDRLLIESKQIEERFERLAGFIDTPGFRALDAAEQSDLRDQYEAMGGYREILGRRIGRIQAGLDRGANIHGLGPDTAQPRPDTDTHVDHDDDAGIIETRVTGGGSSEEPVPFKG